MVDIVTSAIRISGSTSPVPDYTTLTLWEDDIPDDIVTTDEQWVAECYNDWSSGLNDSVTIASRTTDATRNIIVTSPVGQRHTGTHASGFYLNKFLNWGSLLKTLSSNTVFEYLDVINSGTSSAGTFNFDYTKSNQSADSCISFQSGIFSGGTSLTVTNCLAIDSPGSGFNNLNWESAKFYNNTAVSCATGFALGGTNGGGPVLKNNVAFNCTIDYDTSLINSSSTNNATSESTLDSNLGTVTGITSTDFVDSANDDYNIASGSALIDEGTDLSTEFTTDIVGTVRG